VVDPYVILENILRIEKSLEYNSKKEP